MLVSRVRTNLPALTPSWNLDRLFEDFFTDLPSLPSRDLTASTFPLWNVSEDEKSFTVEAEVPGFAKDDLEIGVVGDELRVSGARELETKDEKTSVHRRERFSGKFSRALRFAVPIETEGVEARFKDGVLTVTLPKSQAALPRKIRVQGA